MKKRNKTVGLKSTNEQLIGQHEFQLPCKNGVNFLIRAKESYQSFNVLIENGLVDDALCCLALSYETYLKMIINHSKIKTKEELKRIGHDIKKLFKIASKFFPRLGILKDDKLAMNILNNLSRNSIDFKYLIKAPIHRGITKEDEQRHAHDMQKAISTEPPDSRMIYRSQHYDLISTADKTIRLFESEVQYILESDSSLHKSGNPKIAQIKGVLSYLLCKFKFRCKQQRQR